MGVFKQHQQKQSIIPSFFLPTFEETAFNGQDSKLLPEKLTYYYFST